MKKFFRLSMIIILAFTASCKSEYEIDIQHNPTPVVNCIISPDSIWKLKLVWSSDPVGEYTFKPIPAAVVHVNWGDNEIMLKNLECDNTHFLSDTLAKVPNLINSPFMLQITIGDKLITAEANIPEKPKAEIDVTDMNVELRSDSRRKWYSVSGTIIVKITKEYLESRYYTISVGYRSHTEYNVQTPLGNSPDFSDGLSLRILDSRCFSSYKMDEGYFIDLGQDSPKISEFIVEVAGKVENLEDAFEYFILAINSIEENYYNYSKKIRDQYISSRDPFGQPVKIPSNINNGIGIFTSTNPVYFVVPNQ